MRNVQTYRIARGTGIALLVAGLTFVSMVLWRQAFLADGELLSYQQIADNVGGLSTTALASNDFFGRGVAVIGDLNNDGVEDIAVGAPEDDDTNATSGSIYILFLNSNGTISSSQKLSNGNGGFSTSSFVTNSMFGQTIEGIGDFNGDGNEDIAANYYNGTATGIMLIYLNTSGNMIGNAVVTSTTIGEAALSMFGASIGNLGDLNDDGVNDLIVGIPDISAGYTGGAIVLFFDADGTLDDTTPYQKISSALGNFSMPYTNVTYLGIGIDGIGDFNGDGVEDAVISGDSCVSWNGSNSCHSNNTLKGAVVLLYLNTNGTVSDYDSIPASTFGTDVSDTQRMGTSVVKLGDVNGDGVNDLAFSSYTNDDCSGANCRANITSTNNGAVFIVFMDADGTPDDVNPYEKMSLTSGFNYTVGTFLYQMGRAIDAYDDLDGDGKMDLLIGSQADDTGGTNQGSVFTWFLDGFGGADATAPTVSSGTITETGDTDTSIALSWTAATDETSAQGALVYKVYRGADGVDLSTVSNAESNGTLVDTLTGTTTKTVTSLSPETEYEFNVVVQDEAGNKTAYTALSANTDPTPDTTSPTVSSGTITETGETDTTLTFSWAQATDLGTAQEALTYKIYSAVSGADLDSIADTEANGTLKTTVTGAGSGTISGLSELTTYEINIIVSDAAGNKSLYTQMQAGTGATPDTTPPVPGGSGTLQRSSATSNAVAILWTQATDDETAQSSLVYRLYYATSGTDLDSVADTEVNGTKFGSDFTDLNSIRVTALTANTSYTFQLLVEDASGNKAVYTQLSDSFTSATASSVPTLAFPANTVVSINEGMECTNTRSVTLDIQGANVDRIVVADDNRFLGSIWELFTGSPMRRSYVLQDKEGEQTVYVIFRSWHGNKSFIHQDTIVYRPNDENCTYVATEVEGTTTATEETATETTTETTTEATDTTTGISDQVAPTTTTTTTDTTTGVTETTTTSPSTGTTTTTTTDTATGASTTTVTTTDTSTNTSTTTVETTNPSGATTTTTETAPITAVVPAVPQAPTVIGQQPTTTGIPSDAIVHMGSGGQYFYIDKTGTRRYAIANLGVIPTWVDVTKIQSFVRKDIVKIPLDTTYVLGPKPGSLIVSFGGKYYWLEPSPDGNPLTPVAREFSSTALITQIFGKSWNKYRVILSDTQIKGVTIGPPILDRSQIQVDPTTLKTLQELKRGG